MPVKEIATASAFILTFVLFIPYIRGIRQHTVVPHVFSWAVWALGTFVVFLAQLAGGAGMGAWPIGLSACITGYIAWLAFAARTRLTITAADWRLFALAIMALPAWFFSSDPLWAVVFLTLADLLGFGPTLRKSYARPFEEHAGFFLLGALRNTLVIVALEVYSWTTALFPAAVGLACLAVGLFIVIRRRILSEATPG